MRSSLAGALLVSAMAGLIDGDTSFGGPRPGGWKPQACKKRSKAEREKKRAAKASKRANRSKR